MARKRYLVQKRAEARRRADLVEGPAPQAIRPAIPDLLAAAVQVVVDHPQADYWSHGELAAVRADETTLHVCRIFRAGLISAGDVDLLALISIYNRGPAFPVATRVGDRYVPMTDLDGFRQWLTLQEVTR